MNQFVVQDRYSMQMLRGFKNLSEKNYPAWWTGRIDEAQVYVNELDANGARDDAKKQGFDCRVMVVTLTPW